MIIRNECDLSLFFEVIFQLKWNIGNHILNWIITTRCYYMYIHYYHTINCAGSRDKLVTCYARHTFLT